MHQRAALQTGEHGGIDLLGDGLVVGQDHAAARAAQRLVRGCGHDMGVRHGLRMHAAATRPAIVRHVDHQYRADFVGDVAEAGEIHARADRPSRPR